MPTICFMPPQPNITKLDVLAGDTILDAESAINSTIDQSIKSGSMVDKQTLRLVTQDGTNNDIVLMGAKDGILSGMAPTLGVLTIDIAAGNFQARGKTESFAGVTTIGIAARDANFPRIDLVKTTTSSPPIMSIVVGTPSADPQPPALPAGDAPLYLIWIDPATVATPQDFVLGSFQVDEKLPKDGTQALEDGILKTKIATARKFIDYNPAAPNWDGDLIEVDNSGGAVTLDLPDPTAAAYAEREWIIYASTSAAVNNVILDATASGAFTVNGAASDTISTAWRQYRLVARGGAFYGY